MIEPAIIESKLGAMREYYDSLERILTYSTKEILEDELKLHSIERLFQLLVDTALDINTHIIMTSDSPPPEDYQSTFPKLGELKILPMEFALQIAPSVGLRNLVVHRYGKVDLKRMLDDIKNNIKQYREFMRHIAASTKI